MTRTPLLKKEQIQRKWRLIDAQGKTLGRMASRVAMVVMGKHRPEYHPALDCGDFVVVINCAGVKLTGAKLEQKLVQWHSGWPRGFKERTVKELMQTKPDEIVYRAIEGMLPRNKLGSRMRTRIRTFRGPEHNLKAQQPEPLEV